MGIVPPPMPRVTRQYPPYAWELGPGMGTGPDITREAAIRMWARKEAEREVDAFLQGYDYQIRPFYFYADRTTDRYMTFANHQAMQEATQ